MSATVRFVLVSLCATGLLSCEKAKEEPASRPPAAQSPTLEAPVGQPPQEFAAPARSARELIWKDPAGWQRTESKSAMRKATYRVPRAEGDAEDAELAVFYFGRDQGGGVEDNFKRWKSQFADVEESAVTRSERTANGLRQHVLEIREGTFSSGMPVGPKTPKTNYALLAAVVESEAGAYFFKLTGPKRTVEAQRSSFFALLDTTRLP